MLFQNYSKTEKILIAGIVVVATAIVVSLVYSVQLITKEPDVVQVIPDTTVVNTSEVVSEITQQERTDFLKKLNNSISSISNLSEAERLDFLNSLEETSDQIQEITLEERTAFSQKLQNNN